MDQDGQRNEEAEQQLRQLEAIVKARMTKDAIARYGTVKVAHPQKAMEALLVLGQALQAGKLAMVDDDTLKSVLERLTPTKRQTTIKRI